MTGLEFLKTVRADPKFKTIPFLMVTAEAEKKISLKVKSGVSNYIVKPFTGATLNEKMKKYFTVLVSRNFIRRISWPTSSLLTKNLSLNTQSPKKELVFK